MHTCRFSHAHFLLLSKPQPPHWPLLSPISKVYVCVWELENKFVSCIKQEESVRSRTFTARRGAGGICLYRTVNTDCLLFCGLPSLWVHKLSLTEQYVTKMSSRNKDGCIIYVIILFLIQVSEMFLALTREDLFSAQSDEGWWRSLYYFFLVVWCYSVLTS